jgi:hypothetical protein
MVALHPLAEFPPAGSSASATSSGWIRVVPGVVSLKHGFALRRVDQAACDFVSSLRRTLELNWITNHETPCQLRLAETALPAWRLDDLI